MKDVLPYFERELVVIRGYAAEFCARFPRLADRLGIGDRDSQAERLIQAQALLAARVVKRIDDGFPQFTEALLDSLFPHYLRRFPSCATISFAYLEKELAELSGVGIIERGTVLESQPVQGTRCKFRTSAAVKVAPLSITGARFEPLIQAPSGTRLPVDATASLSITIASVSPRLALPQIALDTLRVLADGDPSFCAALHDTLFMHVSGAYVEAPGGKWLPLPAVPLSPAGYAEDEALIPFGDRSHRAWRILTEYFCFPEKFRFFDIDLAALRTLVPMDARGVTLHLALSRMPADGNAARMLRLLEPANLRLFCTPAVNLFRHPVRPVAVTGMASEYSLVADAPRPQAYEVYSVDAVRQHAKNAEPVEFTPLYARGHAASGRGRHWVLRHDDVLAAISLGHEKRLTLVDLDAEALKVERSSLSVGVTCTNRDLPHQLGYGAATGDLALPGTAGGPAVRLLAKPSLTHRFKNGQNHWRLISHLTLNHHALVPGGLGKFKELLKLHDLPATPVTQRMIDGIVSLDHEITTAWVKHKRGSSLVNGLEVRITVDEEAFVGSGIHLFAQVMDHFLAMYVQVNHYVELVLLSQRNQKEILRCKRRSGNASPA
ncbi:type VI secretion system baseplate subunit TssF [Pseudoduganella lutea]|uniref:Type VI secretion system baseplate subunit TssF n=1 Tax=Pseudoduganella lutea TaxID=321985 RepID=A0A4P6KY52_9BURK|nr:type VI secretion system baseplate subunit TssF [Pseudoduganella lutea]QBE63218.1 type VI secretion system baseplate subunit TssF [Pseudoduganella lutea]